MIITAHIKFSLYTTFLDQMLQAEDERLPNESLEDGVIRVHKQLEAAIQKIKDAHKIDFGLDDIKQNGNETIRPFQSAPAVINLSDIRERESLEDTILAATTLEDLSIIKDACGKAGLISQYMQKLNQLTVKPWNQIS